MEEKRKFIRLQVLLKGEFLLQEERKTSSQMQLRDFSRDGLRLLVPQADLLKMSLVTLKVYLPNKTLPVSVQGKIKWMRPVEDCWEIGMKLEDIDSVDKNEILDYAYKIWKGKERKPSSTKLSK